MNRSHIVALIYTQTQKVLYDIVHVLMIKYTQTLLVILSVTWQKFPKQSFSVILIP